MEDSRDASMGASPTDRANNLCPHITVCWLSSNNGLVKELPEEVCRWLAELDVIVSSGGGGGAVFSCSAGSACAAGAATLHKRLGVPQPIARD